MWDFGQYVSWKLEHGEKAVEEESAKHQSAPESYTSLKDDASEEVSFFPFLYDADQVIEELLAVLLLPVIVPLIYRNDEPLLRSIKEFHQV